MVCLECKLKHAYWKIRHWVGYDSLYDRLMVLTTPRDRVRVQGQAVVTLYKDGKVIQVIKGHNKWNLAGLNNFAGALVGGGSGTLPNKVVQMSLGTQCSDTAYTLITGSEKTTANVVVVDSTVKFTASWIGFGALTNVCQGALIANALTGSGTQVVSSYYNFVTAFTKPVGVDMTIDWTTTLTS